MHATVFDFNGYKEFLASHLQSLPHQGHGMRSKIAAAINCQSAYLSQVLNGSAQLSLEQGERLAHFLKLDDEETDFLFLLIELERAGTQNLKRKLQERKKKVLQDRTDLKKRLDFTLSLKHAEQIEYYSSWLYGVVHLMTSMPALQTQEKIAEALKIEPVYVQNVLNFLLRCGLVEKKGNLFVSQNISVHLGSDSTLIRQHHTNWRLRAVQSLQHEKLNDLHYSSAVSISYEDAPVIKEILTKAIEEVRKVVKPSSPENAVFCYNVDLFELYSAL